MFLTSETNLSITVYYSTVLDTTVTIPGPQMAIFKLILLGFFTFCSHYNTRTAMKSVIKRFWCICCFIVNSCFLFGVMEMFVYDCAQNIDCGYTLEPPGRGGSNKYPQSMFWSKNKKNR